MTALSSLGRPVGRVDGVEKVTGRARYTADVALPGALWAAVLRSPLAHARIVRMDASGAQAVPGVRAVLTGQGLGERLFGRSIADIPVLAYDRVRFVGEAVAAVAATDREAAQEALAQIEVEYEPLPAVFDPLEAMHPDAPLLHPRFREYRRGVHWGSFQAGSEVDVPDVPNLCAYELRTRGNVEQGFSEADLVLEHTYRTGIQHQGYLEPHTCLVTAEPSGTVRVWASNKAPFNLRGILARDLGLSEESIIVEPTFVGGDFGGKGSPMHIPLAFFLSQAAGDPVRLIMDGAEELGAANPRHPAWITIRSGVNRDGTLVAREVKLLFSSGAYAGYKPVAHSRLSSALRLALGVYRLPHARYECRIVYTNHVPAGHMRSPGGAQAAFACEADMDRLAEAVGMDPLEFRLRNVVEEGDSSPLGDTWTSVRAKECLQAVKQLSNWTETRPRYVGRGVAISHEAAGGGGSSALVQVHPDGGATLVTAVNDQGSGAHTMLVQVVGHELQLPTERVRLQVAGTDSGLWDRGSSAMSVTRTAGEAARRAAIEVRNRLAGIAAEYLGCPESQVELVDGRFQDHQRPEAALAFPEVAAHACRDGEPMSGFSRYENWEHSTSTSFVAHVVEAEVDPETGQVKVRRVVAAHDVGTVLNPIAVTGQLEGAMVMGLGFGSLEELRLVDGRIEAAGLHEYRLPTVCDIPELQNRIITDGQGTGPYGAKGVAELGHLPLPAALSNAVYDAVGVRIDELPVSAENVYRALNPPAGWDGG